jgi:SOS response associated peptidase (SRAP)
LCRFHHSGAAGSLNQPDDGAFTEPGSEIINHMCGRYRLSRRKQLVEEYFGAVSGEDQWDPRYNVAPTQPVLTIRQDLQKLFGVSRPPR